MPVSYQQVLLAATRKLKTFAWIWNVLPLALLFQSVYCVVVVASPPTSANDANEIDKLIEALASPNKEPLFDEDAGIPPRYPPGYDHAAQDRVLAARDALVRKGIAAFPRLIRNFNDNRYSCTVHPEKSFWTNACVGSVCYDIISLQVEVYQPYATLPPPQRIWVPIRLDALEKWWDSRKHLGLREIQLEGAKWALDKQRNAYFRSKEEETRVLGDLKRVINRLESSDGPIQVDYSGRYIDDSCPARTQRGRNDGKRDGG